MEIGLAELALLSPTVRTHMYPHVRLLLASLTFSGVLGALVAGAGYAAGIWLTAQPPTDPPDNAAIRAVGIVIFVFAPAGSILSLVFSIPASYLQWRNGPFRFLHIAICCLLIAVVVIAFLVLPGASLDLIGLAASALGLFMIGAAGCWKLVFPRIARRPLDTGSDALSSR